MTDRSISELPDRMRDMSHIENKIGDATQKLNELDLLRKLMLPAVRPRLEELIRNGTTTGPLVIEFDPTTACNFACPECISIGLLNKGQFNTARTLELIDEFSNAGVKGIIFIGGGEPLAHSSMPQPILHAYNLGLAIGLTTNGSLVDRYIDIIAECVQWTRFSVDAGTETTFAVFRPSRIKNSFAKVISNIERLTKIKRGKVGYSFLLLERKVSNRIVTNVHELFDAANRARAIGCDYFEVKPSVDNNHHLIPLSQETKAQLLDQLSELSDLETNDFRIIYPKSLGHLLSSKSLDQPKPYTSCPTLDLRTVVTPKGIYPCPYKRGNEKYLIGSPEVKFDKYWISEERINKSRQIDPSVDCPFHCIRHETNLFLTGLSKKHASGIDPFSNLNEVPIDNDIFI